MIVFTNLKKNSSLGLNTKLMFPLNNDMKKACRIGIKGVRLLPYDIPN